MGKKTGSKEKEEAAAVSGKQGPYIAITRTTRRAAKTAKATAPPDSSPTDEDLADTTATPKATIKPVVWGIIRAKNCGLLERCNRDNVTNRAHDRPSIKFGGSSLLGPLDPPDAEPPKAPFWSAPTPAFGSAQAGRPPAVGC